MQEEREFKAGYFDPETSEYVLEDPRTPMPWMHYLFNREYTALVSVTGGGYSFHKSARDRRLIRMRPNNVPFDRPGRYIYIRDDADGDFFSAGWAPVMKPLEEQTYRCRLGAGCLRIDSVYKELHTALTFFVPPEDNLEVWKFSVTNRGRKSRELSLFTYAEFALYDAVNDRDNYQYTYNIADCFCDGNIIIHDTLYSAYKILTFFSSSLDIAGYECDRERFLGLCRSEANPYGVVRGWLSNSKASGNNPCGAHHIKITLAPGAEREVVFLLGIAENKGAAAALAGNYQAAGYCDAELAKVKQNWQGVFDKFAFQTPLPELDAFSNFWHPYQLRTTFYLSRGPSIYEGGIGRGMGTRDSHQDTLGPAYQLGGELKELLSELMHFQYADGHAAHGFFRLTNEGYGEKYSDDHLWLILSVVNYLKESGDQAFLDFEIPYYQSGEKGTVADHMQRALDFTFYNLGAHRLPLAFHADWNDCLNLRGPNGKGESVWTGFLYHRALMDFVELCRVRGAGETAACYEQRALEMRTTIDAVAWDGSWYARAFDDNGGIVGSQQNTYGKLFLNAQSWAVYSGAASPERGRQAMDMVREKCHSRYGLTLLWPAYREADPLVGSISLYPAGLKENAGIFCHANTWAIIAECLLGRGDYAMEYYLKLLPPDYNKVAYLHRSEPYVYSQVIAGPEHPDFGVARNSWLTGTASWMFVAFTQYLLGIQPHYNGLIIDPCLPAAWDGYRVRRFFRGTAYDIEVRNPAHVCRGVKEVCVDGREASPGAPLLSAEPGRPVSVKVLLGA